MIHIQIIDTMVADDKLHLTIDTTNAGAVGVTLRMALSFALDQTPEQIKAVIDNAATILWLSYASLSWDV